VTTLAVVVPTYLRPDALGRCLESLTHQHRVPDELIVVTRRDDADAVRIASDVPGCTLLVLDEPGVLAAMTAGAHASTSGVICFTDDDAVVPPTWLGDLQAVFDARPLVGGVGGRDVIFDPDSTQRSEPLTSDVGMLTWFGRHTGNHHLGQGPPREVSFLKGVNSAYRREALGLPLGLRGDGAQAHYEIAVGRRAREHGWTLVYDPAIAVEHHPAVRQGADQRIGPRDVAVEDAAYNLVVSIGGVRGLVRVAYATLVGDRGAPGLLRAATALLSGDRATSSKLAASLRGSVTGGWALLTNRGVRYETFT
jgi:GT2 family glycosyltransferase